MGETSKALSSSSRFTSILAALRLVHEDKTVVDAYHFRSV